MQVGELSVHYALPSSLGKKPCLGFSIDNQVLYCAPYISNE